MLNTVSQVVAPFEQRESVCFSDMPASMQADELARVNAELATERSWFAQADDLLLPTKQAVIGAVASGELVAVPFDDLFFCPNARFASRQVADLKNLNDEPGESEFSVPFLRPVALSLLKKITSEAHAELDGLTMYAGIDDYKFAITSMTRTRNYQNSLVATGKLAADEVDGTSSHLYGLAFDIDHSGMYVKIDGIWQAVGIYKGKDYFIPEAIDKLSRVLQAFQHAGVINSICEVPNGRGCFHVAANPDAAVA